MKMKIIHAGKLQNVRGRISAELGVTGRPPSEGLFSIRSFISSMIISFVLSLRLSEIPWNNGLDSQICCHAEIAVFGGINSSILVEIVESLALPMKLIYTVISCGYKLVFARYAK